MLRGPSGTILGGPVYLGHMQAEGRPSYLQLMPPHQLLTFCAKPEVWWQEVIL